MFNFKVSISMSIGCSYISVIVATLKDCSNRGCVSSVPGKNLIVESSPNLSLNVLVQETHQFVLSKESIYHNSKALKYSVFIGISSIF